MPRIGEQPANTVAPTTESTDPPANNSLNTNSNSTATNDRIETNGTPTLSTPQPHSNTAGLRPPGNTGVHSAAGVSISNGVAAVAVHGAQGVQTPDQQLVELQLLAVASAQKELDAGVSESGGDNLGPRINTYASEARMNNGGEWCGYFTNWNYAVAAKDLGGRFNGGRRHGLSLHSRPKATWSFLYRDVTTAPADRRRDNQILDDLQNSHQEAGSTRKFFVFEGSAGHRAANALNKNCEVAEDYRELDIRPGDTALWSHTLSGGNRSHVGLVESYDKDTGILVTIEGNLGRRGSGRVRRMQYDLKNEAQRNQFTGFGRPSLEDFNLPEAGNESSG